MNSQTFTQVEDFTAITDEELITVNGGGFHRPMIGALQNLQMTDQADRHGPQYLGSHTVATMG